MYDTLQGAFKPYSFRNVEVWAAALTMHEAADNHLGQHLEGEMSYEVTVMDVEARPTAVVPATTTWQEFSTLWKELLDEVWTCLHAGGVYRGCRNVMLYLDDVPHVEVGVELQVPCPLTGRVVASALPAGHVAMTVHHGPYAGLAAAHRAVLDWCAEQGRRPAGPRWEIYGPHDDDPSKVWTEVYHLLT